MSHTIIITADDYGMCQSVNTGIDACLEAGAVRATCVMVNMPAWAAAASLRERFPKSSVGIHWTLTQGCPILPASHLPSLVNASGEFHTNQEFRRRWILGRIQKSEVRSEFWAQYNRLAEIAGPPEFWNTHENFHVLPGLFQYCVALGRELAIPAMRCHRRITVPLRTTQSRYNLSHPLYWLKGEIIAQWSRKAEKNHMRMPDGRVYMPGCEGASIGALEHIVERLPWSNIRRAVEVIVHPATSVEEKLFGALGESRVREYEVLRDASLADRLGHCGVMTSGFEAVLASGQE
jgi:chitin disaccharide deacetylase